MNTLNTEHFKLYSLPQIWAIQILFLAFNLVFYNGIRLSLPFPSDWLVISTEAKIMQWHTI